MFSPLFQSSQPVQGRLLRFGPIFRLILNYLFIIYGSDVEIMNYCEKPLTNAKTVVILPINKKF